MTPFAKDLTHDYPRSPFETLEGFPWLPRMIDKVRAMQAGSLGAYTPFPSGGDQGFLGAVGLEPEAFETLVEQGASDAEIGAWVKANAQPGYERGIQGFYETYCTTLYPAGSEMARFLEAAKAELAEARPDVDLSRVLTFGQLLCAEEGHPWPV